MTSRLAFAAAVGSAAIVIACAVGLYVDAGRSLGWHSLAPASLRHVMFFLFVFGWPVAFVATLAAGALGLRTLRRHGRRLSTASAIVPSLVLGGVIFPLVWHIFWSSTGGTLQLIAIGAVAGAFGGTCFWLIAKGDRSTPP